MKTTVVLNPDELRAAILPYLRARLPGVEILGVNGLTQIEDCWSQINQESVLLDGLEIQIETGGEGLGSSSIVRRI